MHVIIVLFRHCTGSGYKQTITFVFDIGIFSWLNCILKIIDKILFMMPLFSSFLGQNMLQGPFLRTVQS